MGANYRAARRAGSRADFVSKITTFAEEADDTQYWLELLLARSPQHKDEISELLGEARELTAIVPSSGKTTKRKT